MDNGSAVQRKTNQAIDEFIDDYKQANNILDELDQHRFESELSLTQRLEKLERELIRDAMYAHNNNKSHAAKSLGISRELLYHKLKKHTL